MDEEIRNRVEEILGGEIPECIYGEAIAAARKKLRWIIGREGDADGARSTAGYIAQLVCEYITARIFSEFTCERCRILAEGTAPAGQAT